MAGKPGTRITLRGEQTREQILSSAKKLFTERGYHYTSVYDLFDHAEVTKGAFFHHWKTKEDLALSLIEQMDGYFGQTYLKIIETPGRARDHIEKAISHVMEATKVDQCYCRLFSILCVELREDEDKIGPEIHRLKSRWMGFWKDLIQRAQTEGDLRSDIPAENLSFLVISAISGVQLFSRGEFDKRMKAFEALRKTILT